jgi:hypothetical protein
MRFTNGLAQFMNPEGDPERAAQLRDAYLVSFLFLVVLIVAFFWVWFGAGWGYVSTASLWALACLASGCAIGFLFGIPRVLQDPAGVRRVTKAAVQGQPRGGAAAGSDWSGPSQSPVPTDYSWRGPGRPDGERRQSQTTQTYLMLVNTNLERVSDWLTGIIVGLGLVHLKELPGLVDSLAVRLGAGLDPASPRLTFAGGLIVSFFVIGLFFGYLLTRLFLQGAFARADQPYPSRPDNVPEG